MFVNFCKRNELYITNTKRTKNTIDYICIRKKALKFIKAS